MWVRGFDIMLKKYRIEIQNDWPLCVWAHDTTHAKSQAKELLSEDEFLKIVGITTDE